MSKIKIALFSFILVAVAATAATYGALLVSRTADAATAPSTGGLSTPGTRDHFVSTGTGVALNSGNVVSTTTTSYMSTSATASTTLQGSFKGAEQLDLLVIGTASSSAAVLGFSVDVSDNAIDWYPVDIATTSAPANNTNNQIAHPAIEVINTFSLATTSATGNTIKRHFILARDFTANYYRVRFGVSGANASIWVEGVPRLPF